jgi:hypothetical protein
MNSLKLHSCYALASAALIGAVACAGGGDGKFSPTGPSLHVGVAVPQTAELCKTGPAGTYDFTVSTGGASIGSDVVDATPQIVLANDGDLECVTVFTRTESEFAESDSPASVTITELDAAGSSLQSIDFTSGAAPGSEDEAAGTVTVWVNAFHSSTATFTNVADAEGCTYTQGWYKNPKHVWPAGDWTNFDNTGVSYAGILATPPKGNVYYILAHQYIAATLNVAGGASDDDIADELSDAADYFAAASPASPLPAGWTKEMVTDLATALDEFNNGITGPGHCDDEVLTAL